MSDHNNPSQFDANASAHDKENRKQCTNSTPTRMGTTTANKKASPRIIIKNPYKKTRVASPSISSPSSTSSSKQLTPEQRSKVEENRKRALERQAACAKKKAKLTADACDRCGSTNPNSLCLVWHHTGDIQRERAYGGMGPYGNDAFRYSCCGRFAPQPCFIGRHTINSQSPLKAVAAFSSSPPRNAAVIHCKCHNGPARLVQTVKDGPNIGRYFFRCSSDRRSVCKFFQWADAAYQLPPQYKQPSEDGVKEWIYFFANPFDEDNILYQGSTSSQELTRKRLIAAMLLHELCDKVTGVFVCSIAPLEEIFETVIGCFEKKEEIFKHLYPLTKAQVARRFGFPCSYELFKPTLEECKVVLDEALQENHVLRAAGVKVESVSNSKKYSDDVIHLEGLENYLRR